MYVKCLFPAGHLLPEKWWWNFSGFCITQILREINFEESRSAKTAIFAILRAVNLVHLVNFSLRKVGKIHKNQNSEPIDV